MRSDGFDQLDQFLKQGPPVVLGFDQIARSHLQTLAQGRVADDFESRVGEPLGRVGYHQLFAVNDAQSGDGFGRGYDDLAGGHGFEDLVLRAARSPQRDNADRRLTEVRPDVRDESRDGDARMTRQLFHFGGRVGADDREFGPRF